MRREDPKRALLRKEMNKEYSAEELKRQLPADLYDAIADRVDELPSRDDVEKEFVKSDLQPQSDPEVRKGVHTVSSESLEEDVETVKTKNQTVDQVFYEEVDE